MGTETAVRVANIRPTGVLVKLNNPLMGTETKNS